MIKKCGIYKIGFFTTEKSYIGQSVDIYRRFRDHLRSSFPEKYEAVTKRDAHLPIHKAIHKYGQEHCYLEILEECSKEQLNEREKYWISYYKTDIKGYNVASGGQESFALSGEKHSQAKLSQAQVNSIKKELVNSTLTMREIAKKYNVSNATITNINQGRNWASDNETYPLRQGGPNSDKATINKKKNRLFSPKEVQEMRKMYRQGFTLTDIWKLFNVNKPCSIQLINQILKYKTYKDIID